MDYLQVAIYVDETVDLFLSVLRILTPNGRCRWNLQRDNFSFMVPSSVRQEYILIEFNCHYKN